MRTIPWAETSRDVMLIVSRAAIARYGANKASRKMRVKVYWNLHRKCWSVQYRGRVVCHARRVELWNATGKVSEPGRQRVLRERKKNVHAFLVGEPVESGPGMRYGETEQVFYNPYKFDAFQIGDPKGDHREFGKSQLVDLTASRAVLAHRDIEGYVNNFDDGSRE